jgi:dihydrofolate synthase / folylpolyglutamate synthase
MNYESAVRYLLSLGRELAAPTQASAAKFDLENISVLSERLGSPYHAYASAHIAGTNGKGSTAAFLEAILRDAGFRTGLNTSPHLERINERIRINGEEISDEAFADVLSRVQETTEELLASGKLRAHPTYFECVTAMAFEYFAQQRVEFGVFEVGLGGRLDSTNILTPLVSIITRIDFDHENFLGHSLREIAGEKAGIIKPSVPVIMAEQRPEAAEVTRNRAKELLSPVVDTSEAFRIDKESVENGRVRAQVTEVATGWSIELAPSLPGRFQLQNALNAVAAARLLQQRGFRVSDDSIARGIATTVWPGRIEKIRSHPDIYLDGAHNPSAARELTHFVEESLKGKKIFLLYGALRDKAIDEVAGLLFPLAVEAVLTAPSTSRAISATQVEEMAAHYANKSTTIADPEKAIEYALSKASSDDVILVTGSLYLVGQLRHYLKQKKQTVAAAAEKR